MIKVELSQNQFNCAKLKLTQNPDVTLTPHDSNTGVLKSKQIQGYYEYDPKAKALTLSQVQKHGVASFASDFKIEEHIKEMLSDLNCPELPDDEGQQPTDIPAGTEGSEYQSPTENGSGRPQDETDPNKAGDNFNSSGEASSANENTESYNQEQDQSKQQNDPNGKNPYMA